MSIPRGISVLSVLVVVGCARSGSEPAETFVSRPECPHDWPERLTFQGTAVAATFNGPGPIKNVPEFHDCQRFIVRDGGGERYDSLFAIFATYRLARLDTLEAMVREQADGAGLKPEDALPAAEIVAWNDYGTLGIEIGFNCLYLHLGTPMGKDHGWKAKMVSFGPSEQDCSQPVDAATLTGGTTLRVHWARNPKMGNPHDYPPVARWDWNDNAGTEEIGIRCGIGWCTVSPDEDPGMPTYASTMAAGGNGLPDDRFRVREIKGWYDQQYLAVPPTTAAGLPTPSRILGTIIPDPELGTHDGATDFDNKWVRAASVALNVPAGVANPYADRAKFNLVATPPGAEDDQLNHVYVCHDTGTGGCNVPATTPACGSGGWWGKVVNAGGDTPANTIYRCITRRDMGSLDIPATVRWRWLIEDEGMWMRCIRGCCEMAM